MVGAEEAGFGDRGSVFWISLAWNPNAGSQWQRAAQTWLEELVEYVTTALMS